MSDARTRIVAAAARLLRDGGAAAVTTRAVAEAAGMQAPAIYRLFGDKDGLLNAVAEHELGRYVSGKATARETDDPVADLRAAYLRHVRFGLENPALFTLLADPSRVGRTPVAAAGLDVLRARVRRVAAAGRLRVPEPRAVGLIHATGTGTILALIADDRDPGLAEAAYDALAAAILTDAPVPGDDHVTSAAVTLRAAARDLGALSPTERALLADWLDRVSAGAPAGGPVAVELP
jgi:AcrR family transcriptional regulator